MIFGSKLEVRQCNSDESSDNKEDDKDDKENAVDCVNPVAPNTGKDVVQLNVYGTERQKSSHSHLRNCFPVPGKWRNLPGVFCGAARSLEFTFAVFTSNTSQNEQRKCHQGPDEHNDTDSAKRQCCCCTISNSNCVQEAECQEERSTKEASCQQQVPHLKRSIKWENYYYKKSVFEFGSYRQGCTNPVCPLQLTVERGSNVSSNSWSQCIDDNQCSKQCTAVVRVEYSNKSKQEYKGCAAEVPQKKFVACQKY